MLKTKNNKNKSTLAPYFGNFATVDNSTLMWISMWISGKKLHIYAENARWGKVDGPNLEQLTV